MIRISATGFACFGLYLLLAGSASASELGTGAAIAVLGALWAIAVRRTTTIGFAFSPAHGGILLRQIGRIPIATARTGLALLHAVIRDGGQAGRSDQLPFRYGKIDEPAERARRATAVLGASLAPASYVVRADDGRGEALFHGIGRRPPDAGPEWLA